MSDPRHTLPVSTDDLIGREHEITDLLRLVGSVRMVSLVGPGGIGKTRLAVHVADRVSHRLDDGVRFADLSGCASAADVARTVARSLRVEDSASTSHAAVVAALRPQQAILVLDTCERAVRPVARLCRRLLTTCPGLRILATSHQPLGLAQERVWRVPPLSLPPRPPQRGQPPLPLRGALRYEAVRLFVNRAHAARPGFELTTENTERVVEICRILDGLPLAIELAAARVRVLTVQQILRRLDDRFRLLVSNGHGVPPRQRTIRAALEWSHDLLTPPERVLLRRLSIFGTWSLDLAGDVCGFGGVDRDQVTRLHRSLWDKSLVVVDAEVDGTLHYRLPGTLRAYATERLAATGERRELVDRFLESLLARAEELGTRIAGTLDWDERLRCLHLADQHHNNVTRVLSWALERGRADAGLRLCVAMRAYWFVRDLRAEGSGYLRALLNTDPESQERAVRARGLAVRAELCLELENARTIRAIAEEALDTAHACGEDGPAAIATATLSALGLRTGDLSAGQCQGELAVELARRQRDRFTEVAALCTLALIARARGDDGTAEDLLTRSVDVAADIGDRWTVARCLSGLAAMAIGHGDARTAGARLTEALTVFEQAGSLTETSRCIAALGRLDLAHGHMVEARHRLAACLRTSVASGRRIAITRALESLAELALAEGHPERAASLAGVATAQRSALGRPARHAGLLRSRVERELGGDTAEKAWLAWQPLPLQQVVSRALEFPAARIPPAPSLLTPREKEIAALVGEGLSNRRIAERLTISQATSARHIANIFRKLGFSSRTQLAEWAGRHGL